MPRKDYAPKRSSRGRPGRRKSENGNDRRVSGPLTPTGQHGPGAHAQALQVLSIEQRRRKVWDLYVHNRFTMAQIAEALKCSASTVWHDITSIFAEMREERISDIKTWRDIEVARTLQADRQLTAMLYGNIDGVKSVYGRKILQLRAVKELRQNQEYRAKLLGLNAPVKIDMGPTSLGDETQLMALSDEALAELVRAKEIELGFADRTIDGEVVRTEPVPVVEWLPEEPHESKE